MSYWEVIESRDTSSRGYRSPRNSPAGECILTTGRGFAVWPLCGQFGAGCMGLTMASLRRTMRSRQRLDRAAIVITFPTCRRLEVSLEGACAFTERDQSSPRLGTFRDSLHGLTVSMLRSNRSCSSSRFFVAFGEKNSASHASV